MTDSPLARPRYAPPPARLLVFVRHGETDWNASGRLQGHRDISLNQTGRAQARANGRRLAAWLAADGRAPGDLHWVASPLSRARETIEIIRAEVGLPREGYALAPQIREIDYGSWEGLTMAGLAGSDPESHAARAGGDWDFAPPLGESYRQLAERVASWLAGLDRDTVCAAHGGIHRVLGGLMAGEWPATVPMTMVPQDRIFVWRGRAAGEL